MSSDPRKPPVRVRIRKRPADSQGRAQERLIADPVPAGRKKRLPNSGSMKPGETRNPKGRPKGAKGTKAITRRVLGVKMTIRENGRPKIVTAWEAALYKERQLAFEGDWRARKTIIELGRWAFAEDPSVPSETPTAESAAEHNAADEAIIAWFEDELARRRDEGEG